MVFEVTTQSVRLREIAAKRGYKRPVDLARAMGMNENTIRSAYNGSRALTAATADRIADFLHVSKGWLLFGEASAGVDTKLVDDVKGSRVRNASSIRHSTSSNYDQNVELVYVEGSVRAGLWGVSYTLPNSQWIAMHLPIDPRFPGIPRHALANLGHSMDKVCRTGGTWVFVLYSDLPGQGPSVGQYVIVERERKRSDGTIEIECSAKRFEMGPGGVPWLYSESDDPSFEPVPLEPAGDIVSVKIIGRVLDVINRL